ncbi:MAG: PrsW family intramembrane metalloprotease [Propionibacteriaceae bacterium]
MAKLVQVPEKLLKRGRRLNGLPQSDEYIPASGPWYQRLLSNSLLWWTLLVVVFAAATIAYQYYLIMAVALERNEANFGKSFALAALGALLPLALSGVVMKRFELQKVGRRVVAGWTLWLTGLVLAGLTGGRQIFVHGIANLWSWHGPIVVGIASAVIFTIVLAVLTVVLVKKPQLENRCSKGMLIAGIVGALLALGWLGWLNAAMTPLPPAELPEGMMVNTDAYMQGLDQSIRLAFPTLAAYTVFFIVLIDRRRPAGWLAWLLALAWGAGASTMLSIIVNSWAGELLGQGEAEAGASNMRTAVYIAPFVEEAAKASILFIMAAFWRSKLVNKLNLVALGGLSAVGFAFTENIIYYIRAVLYASQEIAAGDADAAVQQLAFMRGVLTSWGHPLFTSMTAIGLAVGLRNRSKLARILYPLAGYCVAAGLHMSFNLMASTQNDEGALLRTFMIFGVSVAISLLIFLIRNLIKEDRLIRHRLSDYRRMGWVQQSDPEVFGSWWQRVRLVLLALLISPKAWWHTVRLIRAMVELAYARDSITKGLIDQAGLGYERDLLYRIRQERVWALSSLTGWRTYPYFWKTLWARFAPARLRKDIQIPVTATRTEYSAVDPSWAPPA